MGVRCLRFLGQARGHAAGAGFVVALTGAVVTMPGLSKSPAAYNIDVNDDGVITGLF